MCDRTAYREIKKGAEDPGRVQRQSERGRGTRGERQEEVRGSFRDRANAEVPLDRVRAWSFE